MNKTNITIASYGLLLLSIASYINGHNIICWGSIISSILVLSFVHGSGKISATKSVPFFFLSLSLLVNNKVFSVLYGLTLVAGISLFFDTIIMLNDSDTAFYCNLFLIASIIFNIAFVLVSLLINPMENYIFISLLLTMPWLVCSLIKVKSNKVCYN